MSTRATTCRRPERRLSSPARPSGAERGAANGCRPAARSCLPPGLAAGLAVASQPLALLVGGDQPALQPDLLRELLRRVAGGTGGGPRPGHGDAQPGGPVRPAPSRDVGAGAVARARPAGRIAAGRRRARRSAVGLSGGRPPFVAPGSMIRAFATRMTLPKDPAALLPRFPDSADRSAANNTLPLTAPSVYSGIQGSWSGLQRRSPPPNARIFARESSARAGRPQRGSDPPAAAALPCAGPTGSPLPARTSRSGRAARPFPAA